MAESETQTQTLPTEEKTESELEDAADELWNAKLAAQDLTLVDFDDIPTEQLAKLEDILKELENAAEDARKNGVEEELDERVDVGDSVNGVTRVEGHSKYVTDEDAALNQLREAGVDPTEAMDVKANRLLEAGEGAGLDLDEFIGRAEYTYYRRD